MKIVIHNNKNNTISCRSIAKILLFWVPNKIDQHGMSYRRSYINKLSELLMYGSISSEPEIGVKTPLFDSSRKLSWFAKCLHYINKLTNRENKIDINDNDIWDMNSNLALIILPMLKKFKENHNSIPSEINPDDLPDCIKDSSLSLQWKYILSEMIYAFENIHISSDEFTVGNMDLLKVKLSDNNYQIINGPNHTVQTDWDGYERCCNRIKNGFTLFGKYFQDLWI